MIRSACLAALLLSLAAGPALAACADDIKTQEARFKDQATDAAGASSGGQGVAAARQSQGMTRPAGEAEPTPPGKAAEAGSGSRVQTAKAALEEARKADQEGKAAACAEAVAKAKKELDATP
ncbi:hypothetical protein [Methylobacterium organophilum]|uniref:Uncharacterized protein n=1 Tax=Methylobacterium organophilum TaxID=410 RepID=A0ABQ4TEX6_METOR|nr:hypothetical protein [Methylobacterium organophilum]UMY18591.1 hypothetical protein MMB17_04470 [Methylobacterium organophilum]GJE29465.1 hypothetical protein LKMONMHP_4346 [Methylobacterium organophilum]